ncbi:tRNA lysidine(34) synthetase TilS [Boudabousia tangfeifanii]|uniref:tRNA(Ile)-lysidine synthase n=1 Tax=Boudabousia tangfeifanii TaxID=1912795 RepID=A0A1D9MLN1_9ACTO|nr:tRNA lysidine(34) synthetase TilS [Boudabousia tangfeifanii]AOZ73185.1 tRNA lysidine(34) synthetase TilS [Boudabousia tangfeifanii]
MTARPPISDVIGPNPTGAVRRVSLAIRQSLLRVSRDGQPQYAVVACSGGPDSMALAALTIDVAASLKIPVHTVTIDHQIRPESSIEAEQVAATMRRLGAANASVVKVNLAAASRYGDASSGPEGSARNARHAALERECRVLARAENARVYLLYGHTMDDQAETVLLGLGRGSGLRSLAGMKLVAPPDDADQHQPWKLRPLLSVRRTDTELVCKHLGLPAVNDPTNAADGPWRCADGSALRRAAVREFALPALAGALGKDPAPALLRTAWQMQRDNECLDQIAEALLADAECEVHDSTYTGRRAKVDLDIEKLTNLHEAIVSRIVRLAALQAGANASALNSTQIDAMTALVLQYRGQGPVYLPGGVVAARVRLDPPTPHGTPGLAQYDASAAIRLSFS